MVTVHSHMSTRRCIIYLDNSRQHYIQDAIDVRYPNQSFLEEVKDGFVICYAEVPTEIAPEFLIQCLRGHSLHDAHRTFSLLTIT